MLVLEYIYVDFSLENKKMIRELEKHKSYQTKSYEAKQKEQLVTQPCLPSPLQVQ